MIRWMLRLFWGMLCHVGANLGLVLWLLWLLVCMLGLVLMLGVVSVTLAVVIIRLLEVAFSDLPIWSNKGVFTAWDFLEDAIAKVLHEHLLPTLHIFYNDVPYYFIMMLLKCVLIFHYFSSGVFIPHFNQNCAKDRL